MLCLAETESSASMFLFRYKFPGLSVNKNEQVSIMYWNLENLRKILERNRTDKKMKSSNYFIAKSNSSCFLKIAGKATFDKCLSLKEFTDKILHTKKYKHFVIDLREAERVDSTNLGVLVLYGIYTRKNKLPKAIIYTDAIDIKQVLNVTGFSDLFEIVDGENINGLSFTPLDFKKANITELKNLVLEAHEQLVKLNENNKNAFSGIVNILKGN